MDPGHLKPSKIESPRLRANILSRNIFCWIFPLFRIGYRRKIELSDVYSCEQRLKAQPAGYALASAWAKQSVTKKPSLLRAILSVYGYKFLMMNIIYSFIDIPLRLMQPVCLGGLINYFSSTAEHQVDRSTAYLYATGVVFSSTMNVLMAHPFILYAFHLSLKVRIACSSLIYKKLLRLDLTAGGKASEGLTGHVVNLLTTDAQRFDMLAVFIMDLWRSPFEGTAIVILMYNDLGPSSLIGVALLLFFILVLSWLGKLSANLRWKVTERTDQRIRLMAELIHGIEVIKMYAWEFAYTKIISKIRRKEMNVLKKIAWIKSVSGACMKLNGKVAVFISIVFYISLGNAVTAAKIFVMFFYYDMLKLSMVEYFPMAITFTLEAYVSIQRMQEFLHLDEIKDSEHISSGGTVIKKGVKMDGVTVFWKGTAKDEKNSIVVNTALDSIDLEVQPASLTAIVGHVGAGKTTLLHTILKETVISKGYMDIDGVISYASQDAWLFEASVRQNILFGEKYTPERYRQVVKCCQLQKDLDMLPHGDKTIVGERGVSLSGGQRARVSLARCVYKSADIYLLDDPLAAVDARVAHQLFNSCIRSFLNEKAVLLVTHQLQYARQANNICVMEKGKIVASGTFDELNTSESVKFLRMVSEEHKENKPQNDHPPPTEHPLVRRASTSQSSHKLMLSEETLSDPSIEGEIHASGTVNKQVYLSFIRSAGSTLAMILLAALFCLSQVSYSASDYWLSQWVNMEELKYNSNSTVNGFAANAPALTATDHDESSSMRRNSIYTYAALLCTSIVLTIAKLIFFYTTCINASINLHDSLFRGVTNATMWFFNNNASGRILNRFSKDIGQIDTALPIAFFDCISFLLENIGILVVVVIVRWWLIAPTLVLMLILWMLASIFLPTSRSLKRLEGVARSPALSHATSTLSGLVTVRSCSTEMQQHLSSEFDNLQDTHSATWTLVLTTARAFALWMDIVCCSYLAIITFSFLVLGSEDTLGGNVGLAITQVMGLVWTCGWGIRQMAEVENQMTSAERIIEYANLPSETPLKTDLKAFSEKYPDVNFDQWPRSGELVFRNVSLSYGKPPHPPSQQDSMKKSQDVEMTEVPLTLQEVNFRLLPGEKVGIVGRTGAGKSSLVASLFRLANIKGTILVDGVDTADVGLRDLRARLATIPQQPQLFAGTLRSNLDPEEKFPDCKLWEVLDQVELKTVISRFPAGLNTDVGDGGCNLSSGQRQLTCLARASLLGANILTLDEATANVDPATDFLIQNTIRKKFADKTVLTIAHRLHTIMDSDKVIVMDQGKIVEFGAPFELLTKYSNDPLAMIVEKPAVESTLEAENPTTDGDNSEVRTLQTQTNSVSDPLQSLDQAFSWDKYDTKRKGYFLCLVEQTGLSSARALYQIAEQSYLQKELKKED